MNSAADTTTSGNGECTLREAITNANSNSDTTGGDCQAGGADDHIVFAIGGGGPQTITLASVLPTITNQVVIDGASQPGYAGTPLITVSANGLNATIITVQASNRTLNDLIVADAPGIAMRLINAENATINRVNVAWTGSASRSGIGLYVDSGSDGVTIRHVDATLRSFGILVSGGHDVQVHDSVLANTGQALYMDSVLATTLPSGVLVASTSYAGSDNGVYLLNMADLVVSDTGVAGTTVDLRDSSGAITLPSVTSMALRLLNADNATVDHATLNWTGSANHSGTGLQVDGGSDGVIIRWYAHLHTCC